MLEIIRFITQPFPHLFSLTRNLHLPKADLRNNLFQIEVFNEDGRSAIFDSVIFTIPAPQLLGIDMDGRLSSEVIF